MKKLVFFLFSLSITAAYAQTSQNYSGSAQWAGNPGAPSGSLGAEVLGTGRNDVIAPILMPATGRSWVPGTETNWVPIIEGNEPLNLAPSDTQAFILYQRATSAFRRGEGSYPELYRELIRRFPDSSYTPYAIYSLAAVETDYRLKIRMFLTLKERNKNFAHMDKVMETLGDIYYIMGAPEAAKEVFLEASTNTGYRSPYSSYMLAVLELDSSRLSTADGRRREADSALRAGEAIKHIRKYIASQPNPENTYKAYILYAEALLLQQRYTDAVTVLSNAAPLRPWAYDNGLNVLLYAGEAYYFEGKKLYDQRSPSYAEYYNKSLYAFSLLRLRFARSAEAKIADQFIASLERGNALNAQPEPWIARAFETVIKPRPEVRFQAPVYGPGRYPLTNLPGSIAPPDTDLSFLGDMPKPSPARPSAQEFYIPAVPQRPRVSIVTFTNRVTVQATNMVTNIITNRIFSMFTNVITNQFASVFQTYVTNTVLSSNYAASITNYEMVPVFVTNELSVKTNTVTNIIDVYITNTASELAVRDITNVRPTYYTNYRTNVTEITVTNMAAAPLPRTITNLVSVYTTNYFTNIAERAITNTLTQAVAAITQTNFVPVYGTNIFTNVIDAVITNTVASRAIAQDVTNIIPVYITNRITNIIDIPVTNTINNIIISNQMAPQTNFITNYNQKIVDTVITNEIGSPVLIRVPQNVAIYLTNVVTNLVEVAVTNTLREIQVVPQTNLSYVLVPSYTNINTREFVVTNIYNKLQTNFIDQIFTNIANPNTSVVSTNVDIIVDPGTGQPLTNMTINSNTLSSVELVPIALSDIQTPAELPQLAPLNDPVFEPAPVQEQIIAFQDRQIVRLQQRASSVAEKASSIAGGYQYTETKGYVVRVAQVNDLAVANLIVKEIAKADPSIPVGIYYRDEQYYLEVRNLRSYEEALELSQRLYKMDYTDTQIFERFELTQYTSS